MRHHRSTTPPPVPEEPTGFRLSARSARSLVLLALSFLAAGTATATDTAEGVRHDVRIDAQSIAAALKALAAQTGLQVLILSEHAGDKRCPAVHGSLTNDEALAQILRDSGLIYRKIDENTVAIRAMSIGAPQSSSLATPSLATPQGSGAFRLAQAGVDEANPAQEASSSPAGSGAASLDEVVVSGSRATTATKTDTPLIETPQAISVITADQFLNRGALLFEETLRYSAGVNPESFGTDERLSNAVVRGFYPTDYQDGLRRVFGFSNMGRLDVYALERVELLRGPSSVLYGAGSAGGLINHVSKRPGFTSASEVGLQYGSHDRRQLQFDVTGPLGDGESFAGRLVGVARDSGTQVDHVGDDRRMLMPSLTWRGDAGTEVTLIGTWFEDELGLFPQFHPLVASFQAPPGRRLPDSFFGGEPGFDGLDVRHRSLALLANHRVSDALSFSTSMRYAHVKSDIALTYLNFFEDLDPSTPQIDPFIDPPANTTVGRFASREQQNVRTFAMDSRMQYDVSVGPFRHKVLVGVDYQWFVQTGAYGGDVAAPLNIYAPAYGNIPEIEVADVPRQRLAQLGVYVQDQIDYGDRVHFVAGARRDRAPSRTEPDPEQVDRATTFRAAVIADVWNGVSPYLSYAESFIPVAGFSTFNQDPFVPQEGTMYEAGIKWQPRLGTLLTLAAFDIRETNRFTNHPTDPTLLVQQGEVRSRGIELEGAYRSPAGTEITASYSYVDAQISESNTPGEIGLQLDTTPKHQASLWGMRRFAVGSGTHLRLGAGARYIGDQLSTGVLRVPGYTLVDAVAGVEWGSWSVLLNASNLLDKRHYSTCLVRGDCYVGLRRNVVGQVSYRF